MKANWGPLPDAGVIVATPLHVALSDIVPEKFASRARRTARGGTVGLTLSKYNVGTLTQSAVADELEHVRDPPTGTYRVEAVTAT